MNEEEYIKHLMEQRKGEGPIKLWLEFVGMQVLFGLLVLIGVLITVAITS